MPRPLVISVILNTNRRDDTLTCLDSLAANSYANHRALVLDNASTDGSVAAIRAAHPGVQVISLADNRGYAGNNNVGIQAALEQGADWIFVLNEDTVLAPDCIELLVAAGEADPRNGIVGPLVYHFDEPTVVQSAGGRLGRAWNAWHIGQNEQDRGQFAAVRPVDWIHGCAIMVRAALIEQVGALDERFFYYWEETEWCLRAGRSGWRILHVPAAKLWHKGVQRDYRPGPNVTYYSTRNRLLMLAKHHASPMQWAAAWGELLRTVTSWSVKPRWRTMRPHRDALLQGARDFLRRRWGMRPA